jgi:hypothetical protein
MVEGYTQKILDLDRFNPYWCKDGGDAHLIDTETNKCVYCRKEIKKIEAVSKIIL